MRGSSKYLKILDSRLRGNDESVLVQTFPSLTELGSTAMTVAAARAAAQYQGSIISYPP
jgi:hypothetical protein